MPQFIELAALPCIVANKDIGMVIDYRKAT